MQIETKRETRCDVVIVGAGPTGLMLARELGLAGVRAVVLERNPQVGAIAKAGGLGGQILHLLHYRGLLEQFRAAATRHTPARIYPFGGIQADLGGSADSPMDSMPVPETRVERILAESAAALGADIRCGCTVTGLEQDGETATVDVAGPDGMQRITARYVVGCDGGYSRIRDFAGIAFPGTTYPEVNRYAKVRLSEQVVRRDDGDLEVPGFGSVRAGFTRTDRGEFAMGGSAEPGVVSVYTSEDAHAGFDDAEPMTTAELYDSISRVLGLDRPLGEAFGLKRFTFHARQADRYRQGRVLVAGDAAHLFPATGIGVNAGMLDAVDLGWKLAAEIHGWAPSGLLDTYHGEREFAGARTLLHSQAQVALRRGHDPAAAALRTLFGELLRDEPARWRIAASIAGADIRYPVPDEHRLSGTFLRRADSGATELAGPLRGARPVLVDFADRPDLRAIAAPWAGRVEVVTVVTEDRPADAILLRPDARIAWAAGGPGDDTRRLRDALRYWFGTPAGRRPALSQARKEPAMTPDATSRSAPAKPDPITTGSNGTAPAGRSTDRTADDPRLIWNEPAFAAPDTLAVTSPDFAAGGRIPFRHTATCIGGDNVSPELSWNPAPGDTTALLLAVQDPDAPMPYPFPHCFAVLDSSLTNLPQGALDAETRTPGVRLLRTRFAAGYFGPAPIEGHGPHRYVFQLFALAEPLELPETVSADDIVGAVQSVLARGRYDGSYER